MFTVILSLAETLRMLFVLKVMGRYRLTVFVSRNNMLWTTFRNTH